MDGVPVCWSQARRLRNGWALCHIQGEGGRTLCGIRYGICWQFDVHDDASAVSCERCLRTPDTGPHSPTGQGAMMATLTCTIHRSPYDPNRKPHEPIVLQDRTVTTTNPETIRSYLEAFPRLAEMELPYYWQEMDVTIVDFQE